MKPGTRTTIIVVAEIASMAIAAAVLFMVFRSPPDEPQAGATPTPIKLALPAFELTERSGETVSLGALRGKVWIADFIFTRCPGPCPVMTSKMYQLQEKLREHPRWDDIRLVTFTVDPDFDSPEVMAERARIALADETHWLWLTGTREQIWQLIRDGFKLPVDHNKENADMPIIHSQKFVAVDQAGAIRGFYDGIDDADLEKLLQHIDELLKQPQPSPGARP